jgi:DNA-binding NarL/FixJ family response regulator
VLRWIRRQAGLEALRVVVLTLSDRLQDMNLAYQLGASSFLVKPMDLESLVQIMNAFRGYWLWMEEAPGSFRTLRTIEAHRKE